MGILLGKCWTSFVAIISTYLTKGEKMATAGQQNFLARITSLSKEERFCDIELEFSDGSRKFNRLLLAALSPFFDTMLSSAMKEGLSGVVKLPTVSSEIFEAVVTYYMEGEGELNSEALYEAIDASEMMALPDHKDLCIRNMRGNLNPDSCLRIWQLARNYTSDKQLKEKAMKLIVDNFETVHKQADFLHLSETDLIQIMRSGCHKILQENIAFDAVVKWIGVNSPEEASAMKVFSMVRLQFMQPGDILKRTFQYRDILNKYKAIDTAIEEHALHRNSMGVMSAGKEWASDLHNVIIVCSTSYDSVLHIHAWHLVQKIWSDLSTKIPAPVDLFAAAAAGSSIVVTGGINNYNKALSVTRIFDTFSAKWERGPDLVEARSRHRSVTVYDSIYVLGGYNSSFLNTIEKMSVCQEKWDVVGNLCIAVADPIVERSGRYILVMGGEVDGRPNESYIPVQYFNVESKSTSVLGHGTGTVLGSSISLPFIYVLYNKQNRKYVSLYSIQDNDSYIQLQNHKTDIPVPSNLNFNKCGFVVVKGKGIVYTDRYTREIDVITGGETLVTLPTIPGRVKAVQCAFQTFVADKCLFETMK